MAKETQPVRVTDGHSSIWAIPAGAWEESTWSTRSEASMNDVDADEHPQMMGPVRIDPKGGPSTGPGPGRHLVTAHPRSGVHDGQGPAPAGQLAGDRDVRDHGSLLAFGELQPPLVQATIAGVTPGPSSRRRELPPGAHRGPRGAVGLVVVPSSLDQQPAGVGVAGLGDRALGTGLTRGGLGRYQAHIGPDTGAGQSVPVADLDGQPERGQRGDPAQTAQTVYHRGELAVGGHRDDRLV